MIICKNENRQIGDLVYIGTKVVTPALAEEMLEKNFSNRKINQRRVACYANDMKSGHWEKIVDGLALQFDKEWNLLNGQHRLQAIVQSGIAQEMFIFQKDVSASALALPFDTGMTRSLAVIMKKSSNYIGVISMLYNLSKGTTPLSPNKITAFENALNESELDLLEHIGNANKRGFSAGVKASFFFWGIKNSIEEADFLFSSTITQDYSNEKANRLRDYILSKGKGNVGGGCSFRKTLFVETSGILEDLLPQRYSRSKYAEEKINQLKEWFSEKNL